MSTKYYLKFCGKQKANHRVVAEITHTSFLIWPKRDPHDGFFMRFGLLAMPLISQKFRPLLLNCDYIISQKLKNV